MNKLDVAALQNCPINFNNLKPDVDKQDTDKLKKFLFILEDLEIL